MTTKMVGVLPYHWKRIEHVESRERFDFDEAMHQLAEHGTSTRDPMGDKAIVPLERIERHILLIRGEKVLLDADLAELYGVSTRELNQAVKRNSNRFPADFAFQLTREEFDNLMSQIVTSSSHGGRRKLPMAFTEQGVAMLSSVLRSQRAVQVNVQIMRTFVRLRQMLASHADLARKLEQLERKYDATFRSVFDAIRALMDERRDEQMHQKRSQIGYQSERHKA